MSPRLPACCPGQAAQQPMAGPQLSLLEGQLTWLVYIIGAVIKGRLATSNNADSQVGDREGGCVEVGRGAGGVGAQSWRGPT